MNNSERMINSIIVESAKNISESEKDNFLEQVISVENNAWPPELRASKEKFASRLKVFPDGFFVVKVDGRIKGVTTSLITTYDPSITRTWDEITDNGVFKKSHNPSGNALYVASVGVSADAQGQGIGGKLVQSQIELAKKLGLKYLYLGARIPGFDLYCRQNGDISPEEYLKIKNEKGDTYDPEIRFYERQGLHIAKIMPNFEPDTQSRNYGIVMLWENPQISS
ncbi:MAG: GNAT family N-acetyltransferase [Candidatus Pacearchaeota archaeon]